MCINFYETATAVRNQLSEEDCYYKLKRELLKQIVASYFDCGTKEDFKELQIQYSLIKFSSVPIHIVIDIVTNFLDALSIDMVFQDSENDFCYHETLFFSRP